jgi:hypothetical protein
VTLNLTFTHKELISESYYEGIYDVIRVTFLDNEWFQSSDGKYRVGEMTQIEGKIPRQIDP